MHFWNSVLPYPPLAYQGKISLKLLVYMEIKIKWLCNSVPKLSERFMTFYGTKDFPESSCLLMLPSKSRKDNPRMHCDKHSEGGR